jgi:hypothetical protein
MDSFSSILPSTSIENWTPQKDLTFVKLQRKYPEVQLQFGDWFIAGEVIATQHVWSLYQPKNAETYSAHTHIDSYNISTYFHWNWPLEHGIIIRQSEIITEIFRRKDVHPQDIIQ